MARARSLDLVNDAALIYGVGNFFENAVDFAKEKVVLSAVGRARHVRIEIRDDGPGFPNEISTRSANLISGLAQRGVSKRKSTLDSALGIFISKTLSGTNGRDEMTFANLETGGANVDHDMEPHGASRARKRRQFRSRS